MPKKKKGYDHMYRKGDYWYVWGIDKSTRKRVVKATRTKKVSVAIQMRNQLLRELDEGKMPTVEVHKTTLGQLEELVLDNYEDAEQNIGVVKNRFKALFSDGSPFNRKTPATAVTTSTIKAYIRFRRNAWRCKDEDCGKTFTIEKYKETLKIPDDTEIERPDSCPFCGGKKLKKPVQNSTIKRELYALTNGFQLGVKHKPRMVSKDSVPDLPDLGKAKKRWVEIEEDEHQIILDALPEYLKGIATLAYKWGFRRNEILGLQWKEVNWQNNEIRLEGARVKAKYERTIPLDTESLAILKNWQELRMQHRGTDADTYAFHRNGKKIKDIRGAWAIATEKAGCPHKNFHDYRGTATRNLLWAGVPQQVVMDILGWRSYDVVEHYMHTKEEDRKRVASIVEKMGNGNSK
jgi:site-specific recombinase XerC